MAYKKFLKINGKRYGPYYYQSYRDKTGKVRKRYVTREAYLKTMKTKTSEKTIGIGFINKLFNGVKFKFGFF